MIIANNLSLLKHLLLLCDLVVQLLGLMALVGQCFIQRLCSLCVCVCVCVCMCEEKK